MVASSAAFDGQPGQVAYAASKGAIASLTLPMTRDLARYGIRVVTIAPSLFDSRMTSMMSEKVRKSLERVMEFPGMWQSLFCLARIVGFLFVVSWGVNHGLGVEMLWKESGFYDRTELIRYSETWETT